MTKNSMVRNKDIVSVFVVTAAILMVPLAAMQFTGDVNWTLTDFITVAILLVGTGLLIVLALRKIKNTSYRVAVIAALVVALLLVWIELAVGIFGTPFAGQ